MAANSKSQAWHHSSEACCRYRTCFNVKIEGSFPGSIDPDQPIVSTTDVNRARGELVRILASLQPIEPKLLSRNDGLTRQARPASYAFSRHRTYRMRSNGSNVITDTRVCDKISYPLGHSLAIRASHSSSVCCIPLHSNA